MATSYPIFASDYGGIGAGLANQAALREQDKQFAMRNLLAAIQYASTMEQRRQEQAQEMANRRRVFDEGVRQFNEQMAYYKGLPARTTAADYNAARELVNQGKDVDVSGLPPNQRAVLEQ